MPLGSPQKDEFIPNRKMRRQCLFTSEINSRVLADLWNRMMVLLRSGLKCIKGKVHYLAKVSSHKV